MGDYIMTFIIGGSICLVGQILMSKTKLSSGRILVIFVIAGVILGALNVYDILIKYGKAGASVPLPGFGYVLAKSVMKEVDKVGFLGVFTGGIKGIAATVSSAILFGYLMAIFFNSKTKL